MKTIRIVGFSVLVATASLAASSQTNEATVALPKQPGIVKSEFIYETAPYPSCHASTMAETKEGLIAAWFGGTHERHPDVGIWVARHENGAWTTPVEVATGVGFVTNRLPTWNPVLFQPKKGPLILFYKVGPSPSTWWGMWMTSEDCGRTWSKPQRLPDGMLGPIKNKPVQLKDGSILSPSSIEGTNGWRTHFERTWDLGQTWWSSGPVNMKEGKAEIEKRKIGNVLDSIQGSILIHKGGRLQCIGRTRQGKMFETWSEDGGDSWGEMTLMELPNPNSGTDAVTLKDGRHLLIYNHNVRDGSNNKGRSPLNLALSKDGRKWFATLELENDPDAPNGFAYPAIIQTSDGLVHITYTWKRERIKHFVVDPKKLKLREIVNGEWPRGKSE